MWAGSPYPAFQRAMKARNVTLALAEARALPKLNFADSLELVLIAEKRPELYEKAAVRWTGRLFLERKSVTLAEAQLLTAALGVPAHADALLRLFASTQRVQ